MVCGKICGKIENLHRPLKTFACVSLKNTIHCGGLGNGDGG